VYDEAQLSERLRGKDVVVNLIGILNEPWFGGAGFRRAHTELTRALLLAARSANVGRLLQVSALGAAVDAPSYYLRSKGEAEKLIREQSGALDWTIFQPSVIFGPGDTFLNRFARLLASAPGVLPLARPNARFQPCSSTTWSTPCCAVCAEERRAARPISSAAPGLHTARGRAIGRQGDGPAPLDRRAAQCPGAPGGCGVRFRTRPPILQRQTIGR